jgi:phenylacetate-coenzyme A ligase PaaK-like adenylate-forming protein
LAGEALAGRLKISPRRVTTNSEPLLPEAREAVRKAWGIGVNNMWGSVEVGLLGVECDAFKGMHWSYDQAITELVDHDNNPTTDPDKIDKILVTSLYCRTMPMIRYELTDVAIPRTEPCTCGAVYPLIAEIRGRSDDAFKYGEVSIHPMVFRTPLGQNPMIEQYQVHQTKTGADIGVIARGDVDVGQLQTDIVGALESRGLADPDVSISLVDELERHKETGKMKRFIPLRG